MDLTDPATLAIVAIVVSAITTALMNVLTSWLGRRQSNAQAGKTEAEEDKLKVDTRAAEDEARRKDIEHRLSIIERSSKAEVDDLSRTHAAQVNSLTKGMDDLTAQVKGLKDEINGLKVLLTSEQSAHSEMVKGLNTAMAGLQETITEQSTTITSLQDTVAGQSESLKEASETIASLNTEVAALKQLVSDLIEQIKGLGAVPVAAGESVAT